ncbi:MULTISPECIES: urease accessory protein UreD [Roseobacter]|uniref:urease accessory protein UreD n=1 Tax=Roseobacter TaxID=2433 RepID=UPI001C7E72CF|nr:MULTISPECIES: urease accessory protein UreD [Roseobacter]
MRTATPLDQPRAIGFARVSSKRVNGGSGIDGLRQSGALKLLFPTSRDIVQATLINTAGGVTGGDRFEIDGCAGAGSRLTMTTQAAERAYGAQVGQTGEIKTNLKAEAGSHLFWLPQETILYKNAAIDRHLSVNLCTGAEFLMVEPVLFGRRAMGEDVSALAFRDRIDIRRNGAPIYHDAIHLQGDVAAHLDRPAIGGCARAMASLVWVSPDAQGRIDALRRIIGASGGVSLLHKDVLVMRLLATDGYILRRSLIPVLDLITDDTLPQSWRL